MSTVQRQTRRRSSRNAVEEDDTRPAKKQRLQDDAHKAQPQVNGKTSSKASARAKGNKGDDAANAGFTFTRRAKKPAVKPHSLDQGHQNQSTDEQRANPTNDNHSRSLGHQVESAPKRRSARLSGDKPANEVHNQPANHALVSEQDSRGRSRTRTQEPSPDAPNQADGGLRVEKKRRTTKIALPFADTPVIIRNKEMRKSSAEQRRRSSSTLRGRRASSLIDSGVSNAIPHNEVKTAEFYKHISQELPEPRRMKQLLPWCGSRARSDRSPESALDTDTRIARAIQEELLKDFTEKSEMSDWFSRDDVPAAVLIKQPNPRNIENASKLQELEGEVHRLEREKSIWTNLLNSITTSISSEASLCRPEALQVASSQPVDLVSLVDPQQVEHAQALSTQPGAQESIRRRVQAASDSLEFKIDSLASSIHQVQSLGVLLSDTVETVVANAAQSLEERDKARQHNAGAEKVGIGDLLRSFSRNGS